MLLLGLHRAHGRAAADLGGVPAKVGGDGARALAGRPVLDHVVDEVGAGLGAERPDGVGEQRPAGRPVDRARGDRAGDVERVDVAGGLGEAHPGEPVDVLGLAVGPEPDALDARQVEAAPDVRHGLLPEVAGRLADAAQPHRQHAGRPPAAPLLAGVGHDRLHLRRGPVAHAHVGPVGLDEHLLGGGCVSSSSFEQNVHRLLSRLRTGRAQPF